MNNFKVKYNDKFLMPALIVLMNAINLYIAHPHRSSVTAFIRALAEDTTIVIICWLAMRALIIKLDSYYRYQDGVLKRVTVQVFLSLLLTCGLLLTATWLSEHLIYQRAVPEAVYTHHIWVYAFWILIHNGIYITIYLWQWNDYLHQQHSENTGSTTEQTEPLPQKLSIKLGNKNFFIDTATIMYCTTVDDFSKIYTDKNESFLIERSLQSLEEMLPQHTFFRVNRQYIVNRYIIAGLERIENGKLKLTFAPGFVPSIPVIVSRTKAPELKNWLTLATA